MTEQDEQPLKKPKPIDGSGPSTRGGIQRLFRAFGSLPRATRGMTSPAALETRGVMGFDHYYEWLRDEFVWPLDVRRQFLDKVREFEAAGQAFSLTYANLDGEPGRWESPSSKRTSAPANHCRSSRWWARVPADPETGPDETRPRLLGLCGRAPFCF